MDRITQLRLTNVRAFEDAVVEFSPVTVLIGENGAGKSTALECLELLRVGDGMRFDDRFNRVHGGWNGLMRSGARSMALAVRVEDADGARPALTYELTLGASAWPAIERDRLVVHTAQGDHVLVERAQRRALVREDRQAEPEQNSNLSEMSELLPALADRTGLEPLRRMQAALSRIQVHLPLDTTAAWAARRLQLNEGVRGSTLHAPAQGVGLLGRDLANAWATLRNQSHEHWEYTRQLVQLGLGEHVDSVVVQPDAGGGRVALALRLKTLTQPISAAYLSDGQLAWLAFVAIARLSKPGSLIAIDEPELHLHPGLIGRVIALFAELPCTVVFSTHSDRVLDVIDDPASAVRVLQIEQGSASVSVLDPAELPGWLEDFGGLGELRASGYLPRVLADSGEERP